MVYRYQIEERNNAGGMSLSPIYRGMTSWDQENPLRVTFYSFGCRLDDGTHNCTAFCSRPDLIWGSQPKAGVESILSDITNCFSLLKASYILELAASDPTISAVGSYPVPNESGVQDTSITEIAERLGLHKASALNLTLLSSSLGSCMMAFCQSAGSCALPMWTTINVSDTSILIPDYYGAICSQVSLEINSDVAGLGIVTGYLLTLIFLTMLYLATRICTTWLQYLVVPYYWAKTKDLRVARITGKEMLTSEMVQHCKAVLVSGTADFQKGQCLFWLAIAIASIVAIRNPSQALGSTSIAGTRLNLSALSTICALAVTSISCGFYLTSIQGKFSLYATMYAALDLALCIGIQIHIALIKPAKLAVKAAPDAPALSVCGYVPPSVYCDGDDVWKYSLLNKFDSTLGGSLASLMATAAHAFVSILIAFVALVFSSGEDDSEDSKFARRWHVLAETTLGGVVIFFFIDIATAIRTKADGAMLATWGFGQIIAVTIWWPILIEGMVATLIGLDKSYEHRIVYPYRILRTRTRPDNSSIRALDVPEASVLVSHADDPIELGVRRRRTDLEARVSRGDAEES